MENISGAKWFKIDFHMHTDASSDYRDKENYTHEKWLLQCMKEKLDGVVISDHNTGKNIDSIVEQYEILKNSGNPDFRELIIFPGVELTVHQGIHLLVIFPEGTPSSEVSKFIGNCGFPGNEGDISSVTTESLIKILDLAVKKPYNAICIPAHVDCDKGLFEVSQGETLREAIKNKNIIALEQIDKNYEKPRLYFEEELFHHRVLGSDSHTLSDIGKNYTWLKMGKVSLDGIKIVLSDKLNKNVICSDEVERSIELNNVKHQFIRSIKIKDGYKIGRGPQPVQLEFSPWLNTIIGGRGSGKSTIVKMLQYALGKHNNGEDDPDFFREGSRNGKGMLTKEIEVEVEFIRYENITRLKKKIEDEYLIEENGEFIPKNIETIQKFYPVTLITQKELFEMAIKQGKLFDFIDRKINFSQWEREFEQLKKNYFESKAKERKYFTKIRDKQLIQEQIEQIDKILATYNKYSFTGLLKEYQTYHHNISKINNTNQKIKTLKESLSNIEKNDIFQDINFLGEGTPDINQFKIEIDNVYNTIKKEIVKLEELSQQWIKVWKKSEWYKKYQKIKESHQRLQQELAEQNCEIDGYNQAIKDKENFLQQLSDIEKVEQDYAQQCNISQELLDSIQSKRKELFELRKSYIDEVNERLKEAYGEIRVHFDIVYLGNLVESEQEFREIIGRTDGKFDNYIYYKDPDNDEDSSGLLFEIEKAIDKEEKLKEIKERLLNIEELNRGEFNGWFVNHIKKIFDNDMKKDQLLTWFPKDKLEVKVVLNGREENIETASPGQKATALMTYIITETDGPLIIDQPEDDLDNRMVTSLIVDGIRKIKENRQVIIITHNPNIPVNASAEKIFEMHFVNGQIQVKEHGTLQDEAIRSSICDVMEGGIEALEHRFNKVVKI
jgi:predicted ATPase